jgi:putative PEP-CTERM system TPR-repeat lipoprotein
MTPSLRLASAALLLAGAAFQPARATPERARAAQARGDLRAAQIEWRNAVRAAPNDAALRLALGEASLDVGDGDTAEKEARAALERGGDRVAATSLLMRGLMAQSRARDLLREFREPDDTVDPRLAAQIQAGRSTAHLAQGDAAAAERAAEAAIRLAPSLVEAQLAASTVAAARGDRRAAEEAVDRALAAEPDSVHARLRKAAFLFERNEAPAAVAMLNGVLAARPGLAMARVQRAEAFLRMNDDAAARRDVEAALRSLPGYLPAAYTLAAIQVRAQDWRGADETLTRIGGAITAVPDGLLLLAATKRALGQQAQALDAAQRYVARRPEDPRGARLLASFEMEARRPREAAAILENMLSRAAQPDLDALLMLGQARMEAGRPREAAEALARAVEQRPDDAELLSRLAAARFAAGDLAGMGEAARRAVEVQPNGPAARLMLAAAALTRGASAEVEAELSRLAPEARRVELARLLAAGAMVAARRWDEAAEAYRAILADLPENVPARLGLSRTLALQGQAEEAERLLAEVLARDPANAEAAGRLASGAAPGSPRAAQSLTALEAANRQSPGQPMLALVTANALLRSGQAARAVEVLGHDELREQARSLPVLLTMAEARAAAGQFAEAEAAARAALAEAPDSSAARRVLSALLARRDDLRGAEAVIEEGLRQRPGDAALQSAAVGLARRVGGVEAALAAIERVQRRGGAMPAAASLRGDLMLAERRPQDAAQAYEAAFNAAPSSLLAQRGAAAWLAIGRNEQAAQLLRNWVQREPNDVAALNTLSRIEIAAGQDDAALARLRTVLRLSPTDATALNNAAWLIQKRGNAEALAEARPLAERALFLAPTAEAADTLGWIMLRQGDAAGAVPLLRQAVTAAGAQPDPGMVVRLAQALRDSGNATEARRVLEPILARQDRFPERAEAERLMGRLRGG